MDILPNYGLTKAQKIKKIVVQRYLNRCTIDLLFHCNYSADKLIGYEHIVGLHPGAAADENTRLHRFRLHRGAALH